MSRRSRVRNPRQRNLPLRFAGVAAASLIVAIIGGKFAIDSYLRSERFREFISRKAGDALHAEAQVAPLEFSGGDIYTDGLKAKGNESAAFSILEVDQMRAELSARRFFEKVWQVDNVDIQRLAMRLDGERASAPAMADAPSESRRTSSPEEKGNSWLPNRVEVSSAAIHDLQFQWQGGRVTKTAVQARQADGGWIIEGSGGQVEYTGLPQAEIASFRVRYRAPSIFLQAFEVRQGASGTISAAGEIQPGERLDLSAKFHGISVTSLLPPDWRVRLHGELDGDVQIQSRLPADAPQLGGTVRLSNGQLEALPVLDEIAAFTRMAQYRRLTLSKASGDFRREGPRLTVTNFVAESQGLIRIQGGFRVEDGNMDGRFEVGVTPASLQWLPGSQERVFTTSRDGYVWTPMHLEGPLSQPKEDLSPRLIAAAQGAVIERAASGAGEAVKAARDAAKTAVDLLFGPSR